MYFVSFVLHKKNLNQENVFFDAFDPHSTSFKEPKASEPFGWAKNIHSLWQTCPNTITLLRFFQKHSSTCGYIARLSSQVHMKIIESVISIS